MRHRSAATAALATAAAAGGYPAAVVARPVPAPGPAELGAGGPGAAVDSGRRPAGTSAPTSAAHGTSRGPRVFLVAHGPVIGHDYQTSTRSAARHLWLFQDTFLDTAGNADRLDQASFAHNTAMLQDGACFTLLHRGTPRHRRRSSRDGRADAAHLVLAARRRDAPTVGSPVLAADGQDRRSEPPDGLGLGPRPDVAGHLRLGHAGPPRLPAGSERWRRPDLRLRRGERRRPHVPVRQHVDRNLARQGGSTSACPCSSTAMSLAVCIGLLDAAPEYRPATGWSADPRRRAVPHPLPRREPDAAALPRRAVGGRPRSTATGPTSSRSTSPSSRGGRGRPSSRLALAPHRRDPLLNTYHAHLMPWLSDVTGRQRIAQRPRHVRDAWPHPERTGCCSSSALVVATWGSSPLTPPASTPRPAAATIGAILSPPFAGRARPTSSDAIARLVSDRLPVRRRRHAVVGRAVGEDPDYVTEILPRDGARRARRSRPGSPR